MGINQALDYLGIGSYFRKEAKIVFLGLDNAGKTTLFNLLKTGKISAQLPTDKAVRDELVINGVTFNAHDVGGHAAMRRIWKDYCVDVERFPELRSEMNAVLTSQQMKDIPILVLGNKIDKKGAVNENQLKQHLGLSKSTTGKNSNYQMNDVRPLEVFMCSLVKKAGFADGLKWLSEVI